MFLEEVILQYLRTEINIGKIKQKMSIMNIDGKRVGIIHQVQDKGKTIDEATKGMQVAVSINGPQIGRQLMKVMYFILI